MTSRVVASIKEHTDITMVDLKDALWKAKRNHQVYYKTDTHWNHFGANVAQYEIMNAIERIFPGQIHPELKNMTVGVRGGGDLSKMIGVQIFKELNPQPLFHRGAHLVRYPLNAPDNKPHTIVCEGKKLKAVILKDSFFKLLEPYFSRAFKKSTYIPWAHMDQVSLKKYVESEKPDIVIEEMVERFLPYILDRYKFVGYWWK